MPAIGETVPITSLRRSNPIGATVPITSLRPKAGPQPTQPSIAKETGKGLLSGALNLAQSIGGSAVEAVGGFLADQAKQSYAIPSDVRKTIQNPFEGQAEMARRVYAPAQEALAPDPSLANVSISPFKIGQQPDVTWQQYLAKLGRGIGETVPSAAAAAGGFAVGGPLGAGVVGGALEGLSEYEQAKQAGATEEEARRRLIGMGISSAALNALPFASAASRFLGTGRASILARALVGAATEGTTETLEGPLAEVVKSGTQADWNQLWDAFVKESEVALPAAISGGAASTQAAFEGESAAARRTPTDIGVLDAMRLARSPQGRQITEMGQAASQYQAEQRALEEEQRLREEAGEPVGNFMAMPPPEKRGGTDFGPSDLQMPFIENLVNLTGIQPEQAQAVVQAVEQKGAPLTKKEVAKAAGVRQEKAKQILGALDQIQRTPQVAPARLFPPPEEPPPAAPTAPIQPSTPPAPGGVPPTSQPPAAGPTTAPAQKQPWEMTKEEFKREYVWHGSPDVTLSGKLITGFATNSPQRARTYATTKDEDGEPRLEGSIYGYRTKDVGEAVGSPEGTLTLRGNVAPSLQVPATVEDPHRHFIDSALQSGDLTPARARELGHFDTYPDLAAKYGTPVPVAEAPTVRESRTVPEAPTGKQDLQVHPAIQSNAPSVEQEAPLDRESPKAQPPAAPSAAQQAPAESGTAEAKPITFKKAGKGLIRVPDGYQGHEIEIDNLSQEPGNKWQVLLDGQPAEVFPTMAAAKSYVEGELRQDLDQDAEAQKEVIPDEEEVQGRREEEVAPVRKAYTPYKTTVTGRGEMWAVPTVESAQRKAGDLLFNSLDEAQREAGRLQAIEQKRAEPKPPKELSPAEKAQAEARNLRGFLSDRPEMHQEKARKALNGQRRFNGRDESIKDHVESMVADGAQVITQNGERRLSKPDGSYLSERQLNKTAMDYAEYLATPQSQPEAGATETTPGEAAPQGAKRTKAEINSAYQMHMAASTILQSEQRSERARNSDKTKRIHDKAWAALRLHAAKLGIEIPTQGTYFNPDSDISKAKEILAKLPDWQETYAAKKAIPRKGPQEANLGMFEDIAAAAKEGKRFVQELYDRVKPALSQSLQNAIQSGKTALQWARDQIKAIGSHIAPYVKRVAAEARRIASDNRGAAITPKGVMAAVKASKVGKAAKKNLSQYGEAPKEVSQVQRQARDAQAGEVFQAKDTGSAMQALIRQGKVDEATVGKALTGDTAAKARLTPEARQMVTNMRSHITEMQKREAEHLKAQGKPGQAATILRSVGTYLHRSYKMFDPATTKEAWMKKAQAMPEWDQMAKKVGGYTQLNQIFEDFFQTKENLRAGKAGRADMTALMERKVKDPLLRKLMGEKTSPVEQYLDTIITLSQDVAMFDMQKTLLEHGKGKWLWDAKSVPQGKVAGGQPVLVGGPNNEKMGYLSGIYATPEVARVFNELIRTQNQVGTFWKAIYAYDAYSKASKTAWNAPTGAVRQLWSDVMFVMTTGNTMRVIKNLPKAARYTLLYNMSETLAGYRLTSPAAKKILYKLAKKGLFDTEVVTGQIGEELAMMGLFQDVDVTRKNVIRRFGSALTTFYRTADNMTKVASFFAIQEQYKAWAKSKGMTQEQLEDFAAEMTMRWIPNNGLTNEVARSAGRNFFLSPFLRFHVSTMFAAGNVITDTTREIASGDPELRKIAVKRIPGIIGGMGMAVYGLEAFSKMLYGISDDEEKVIRESLPEWSKRGTGYFARDRNSDPIYVDTQYMQGYPSTIGVAMNVLSSDSPREAFEEFKRGMAETFLQGSMIIPPLMTLFYGRDPETGREVLLDENDWRQNMTAIAKTMLEPVLPGGKSYLRLYSAMTSGKYYDQPVDTDAEVKRIFSGFTITKPDPVGAFVRDATKYNFNRNWSKVTRDLKESRGMSHSSAVREVNKRRKEEFNKLAQQVKDMVRANPSQYGRTKIKRALRKAGFGDEAARAIVYGRYRQYQPEE